MKKKVFIFLFMLLHQQIFAQQKFTISGYVKELGSMELLPGATVYFPQLKSGTTSNNYGFYSITLPEQDSLEVVFSYIGFTSKMFVLQLHKNINLSVELIQSTEIKTAEVTAEKTEHASQSSRMSVIELPINQIKDLPSLLGEKDVLKVLQLMPGVQKSGEGNSGFYVRGGGSDQNLIILDDAPVYNAYHLFGFFSLFNGDALKSVEFTKGGFPARYGGRLSSVIDMTMKDGNKEGLHAEGGIGLISSQLTVEGPVKKNKSSFLVSARRTYLDALSAPFQRNAIDKYYYYFFDANAKMNFDFGDKNKLYISGYFGKDKFYGKDNSNGSDDKYALKWGNATGTLRWNHLFNSKTFTNNSVIFSDYKFQIDEDKNNDNNIYSLRYFTGIRDFSFKYDVDFRPGSKQVIKAGLLSTFHRFTPYAQVEKDSYFNIDQKNISNIDSYENALYAEDDIHAGSFRFNIGLRLSQFYADKKNYLNAEPRIAAAFNFHQNNAIKVSYAIMNQYIHQLSNSGTGLPTDLWVPSTAVVKPMKSQQVAAGYAIDIPKNKLAISVEGYYKWMENVLAYREGASFLFQGNPKDATSENENAYAFENKVTSGKSWSYGGEFLWQKREGRFNGWIGYTLSWTYEQFDDLNFGEKFFARYDRRHDISVVGIYKLRTPTKERNGITFSATWVYGTGNAITLPLGDFNAPVPLTGYPVTGLSPSDYYYNVNEYTKRNDFRMAAYHRLDVGVQFIKQKRKHLRTWEVSIFNVYNRPNPYYYFIGTENNKTVLKQVSLFGITPSVSYNFKF